MKSGGLWAIVPMKWHQSNEVVLYVCFVSRFSINKNKLKYFYAEINSSKRGKASFFSLRIQEKHFLMFLRPNKFRCLRLLSLWWVNFIGLDEECVSKFDY